MCRRYGVRGYPFLLYFAKNGKRYRYRGGRSLRSLAAFARGDWASEEPYDPTARPPPKPKFSLTREYPNLMTALGVTAGLLTVGAMVAICCDMLQKYRTGRESRVRDARPKDD